MAFYAAPDLCLEKKYFGKWSNTTLKDEKRKNKKQQKIGKDEGNFFLVIVVLQIHVMYKE